MSHLGLTDRKRRDITLQTFKVKDVLPSWWQEENPRAVTLLEKYFEWLADTAPANLLEHLFETKDLLRVDDDLLQFVEDELLLGQSYFNGFPDRRTAAIFANVLYKVKGSRFSIQQFFRMFLNEDPDIIYPKDNVFKLKSTVNDFQYYNLYLTLNKTRNYQFGYPDLLRSPSTTLYIIDSTEFVVNGVTCKLKNELGSTNLQIVNSSSGAVVTSSIGAYDPLTGVVTINGLTATKIMSGDEFIQVIGRRVYNLDESFIGPDSKKFLTDDKLYQTYAILIKSGVSRSDWESIYKLFVHPAGMYLGSQVQIVSEFNFQFDDQTQPILEPPRPTIYEAVATGIPTGFLSASGYLTVDSDGYPSTGPLGNRIRVHLEPIKDTVEKYQSFTVQQLHWQYGDILEIMRIKSPDFTEDHDVDSSGIGFSNTIETFDQDRWFSWSSDSATYDLQKVARQ